MFRVGDVHVGQRAHVLMSAARAVPAFAGQIAQAPRGSVGGRRVIADGGPDAS
jgi:hypothetical protein